MKSTSSKMKPPIILVIDTVSYNKISYIEERRADLIVAINAETFKVEKSRMQTTSLMGKIDGLSLLLYYYRRDFYAAQRKDKRGKITKKVELTMKQHKSVT